MPWVFRPAGIINSGEFVGAQKRDEEILIMLALVAEGTDPIAGAKVASRTLEIDLVSDAQLGILNGLQAARTQAQITGENGEIQMLELTWIAHGGLIYQVMGVAALDRFEAVEDVMRASAQSFRPLTDEERSNILVVKLHVVEGRQGETIAEMAERAETLWSPEAIAVVNRKPVTEPLELGEPIKVGIQESYARDP